MRHRLKAAINMTAVELLPYVTMRRTRVNDEQVYVYSLVYHVHNVISRKYRNFKPYTSINTYSNHVPEKQEGKTGYDVRTTKHCGEFA